MENAILKNQETARFGNLVLKTCLALLPGFTGGATISYAAVAMPYYLDPENTSGLVMTIEQASWFVSLNSPMQMFGNLLSGVLLDKFGRKHTMIGSSLMVVLASAILSFAPNYAILLVGCLLNGSAVGVVRPAIGLYLSEVSLIRWRGTLGSLNALTPNAGYLYGIMVGSLLPVRVFPWVMVGPSILFLLLSWVISDTPLWYMKVGRSSEARKEIICLRGENYKVEPELKELEDLVACDGVKVDKLAMLQKKSFILPALVLGFLFAAHASVGADTLSYYSLTLFFFPGVHLSPSVIAVLFQSCFSGGMMATALLPQVGRRFQWIGGSLLIAAFMFLMGLDNYTGLSSSNPSFNYLPVILLLSFAFSFGIGIGTICWTLTGEIFPQHLRTYGCALTVALRYVVQFIQLKLFFSMRSSFGMTGVYWIQGCIAIVGAIFAFFFLPETRNKTFSELERIFEGKAPKDVEKDVKDIHTFN